LQLKAEQESVGLEDYAYGEGYQEDDDKWYITNGDGTYDVLVPIPKALVRRDSHWIKDMIITQRHNNLPIFVNPLVFQHITATFIREDWHKPCHNLVNNAKELLQQLVATIYDKSNLVCRYPSLKHYLTSMMNDQINTITAKASNEVDLFLEREYFPYSQDHDLFENLSKKRFEIVKSQIYNALSVDTTIDLNLWSRQS
jgi:Dynamin central region